MARSGDDRRKIAGKLVEGLDMAGQVLERAAAVGALAVLGDELAVERAPRDDRDHRTGRQHRLHPLPVIGGQAVAGREPFDELIDRHRRPVHLDAGEQAVVDRLRHGQRRRQQCGLRCRQCGLRCRQRCGRHGAGAAGQRSNGRDERGVREQPSPHRHRRHRLTAALAPPPISVATSASTKSGTSPLGAAR